MGGDPGIFWLGGYDILVTLLIGCLYGSVKASQLPDLLDIPV